MVAVNAEQPANIRRRATPAQRESVTQQRDKFFAAMTRAEQRSVIVVALIAMIRMFGLFALLPVLAIYAATFEDATPLLVGLAVGAYGLTQAALQLPLGAASDRFGRIPVILAGLAMFAAGSVLAATSDSIYGIVTGRFLQGAGAVSATLAALLSDATRDEVRTRSMAVLGIGIGASFLLALILGPVLAAAFGVRFLFWLAASLALLAASMLLFLPRDIHKPHRTSTSRLSSAFRPELLQLDLYVFLLHALLTAGFVALPFLLRDQLGMGVGSHWQIYVAGLIISLAGTIPLVIADDRQGKSATLTFALLLLMIGQALLAWFGGSALSVIVALAVFFAGFNFLEAGLPARLSRLADGERRGASLGVFSSCQFLGAFAGGVAGGALMSTGQAIVVFQACAVLSLVWLIYHGMRRSP